MDRTPRKKSSTNVYHIIQQGINRKTIFYEAEDCERYLSTLQRYRFECSFELFAYCLMSNHVHLLVRVNPESCQVGDIVKRISDSFVYWYNEKYLRSGHLFNERYRSEAVESDDYLVTVTRYIHQNPVKAGLVEGVEAYEWSSYSAYLQDCSEGVDTDFVLKVLNGDGSLSTEHYIKFMNARSKDQCLEADLRPRLTDVDLSRKLCEICGLISAENFNKRLLRMHAHRVEMLLSEYKISDSQLSRVTGMTRYCIRVFRYSRLYS